MLDNSDTSTVPVDIEGLVLGHSLCQDGTATAISHSTVRGHGWVTDRREHTEKSLQPTPVPATPMGEASAWETPPGLPGADQLVHRACVTSWV